MSSQNCSASTVHEEELQSRDSSPPLVFACQSGRNERTFPGPWKVEQISQGYRVLDAKHHVLAYVIAGDKGTKDYSGELTFEEARRIARVIASLPDLILKAPTGRAKRSWWASMRRSA